MTETLNLAPPDYRAALEGAALYDEAAAGRIFMRGRDRADLLHRLSTNDIKRLQPGQGARTVLTSPIGRIIDLLTVHALEDALLVVTSPGQGPAVYAHLRKNIFFQDQVTLEPAGRSHGQLALYGPAAAGVLQRVLGVALADLPLHHLVEVALADQPNEPPVLVARREPIGGQGFTLYIPAGYLESTRQRLLDAGAAMLSPEAFDILRIECGYGTFGRELSPEYIPLETGLLDAISFTKGCYVGQEIIARMESRGRLAKQLRGLRLTAADGASIAAHARDRLALITLPAKLEVAGKEAGDLTSAVVSPRFGPIGLAYVRTAHAAPGNIVGIAGTDLHAEVVTLPFDAAGPPDHDRGTLMAS
jgi:aminomethyltransferase